MNDASRTSVLLWRLLLALLSIVLLIPALLFGALVYMDDGDFRNFLILAADRFLDSELTIEGPVRIRFDQGVQLTAEGVTLQARDDRYLLEAALLRTTLQPFSVVTGPLWIDRLELYGLHLMIHESPEDGQHGDIGMPGIFVANAAVSGLVIEYQERHPGTLHRFVLHELHIADEQEGGPIRISASGDFEEEPFSIRGSLPSLHSTRDSHRRHPVSLSLVSGTATIDLSGTIADPFRGNGLELELQAVAGDITKYLEIFDDAIPPLGDLELSASVRGNLPNPRFEDIDLQVHHSGKAYLRVRGTVGNPFNGEGADLALEGYSESPVIASWLLLDRQDGLRSLRLNATLREHRSRHFIENLDLAAETTSGLEIAVTGAGELFGSGHRPGRNNAGFRITVNARTSTALNLAGLDGIPEIGRVTGSAAAAFSSSGVGLFDADLRIGSDAGTRLVLKGDIDRVPYCCIAEHSPIVLDTNLRTSDLAELGNSLGLNWPALGPARLTGDLQIRAGDLNMDNARLELGRPAQPMIRASGSLARSRHGATSASLRYDAVAAELATAMYGPVPGKLGVLQGTIELSGQNRNRGAGKFTLQSARTDLYRLNIRGSLDDLANFNDASGRIQLTVDDMKALGAAFGWNLPDLGSYRLHGTLAAENGRLEYRGNIAAGKSLGRAELSGQLVDGKPGITGSVRIPALHLPDIGPTIPGTRNAVTGKPAGPAEKHVFSRKHLNTAILDAADLDLDVTVEEIIGKKLSIDQLKGRIRIQDGHLRAVPFVLTFQEGKTNLELDVRHGPTPQYSLKVTGDDIRIGDWLAQVQEEIPLRGRSSIHLDLTGRGQSLHELAAGLNGTLSLSLENARIPAKYVSLLSADVFGWVLTKSAGRHSHVNLNCVMVSFEANEGRLESQTIVADGPSLSIGGKINLDLARETLDIVLLPKQKQRIFSSMSPVRITGPMRTPRVDTLSAKVAMKEIGSVALLPGVVIPAKAIEKLWELLSDADQPGEGCESLQAMTNAAENGQDDDPAGRPQ